MSSNKIEQASVPVATHTREALYLVELNRELRAELSVLRGKTSEANAELLATTAENERMEEQLRYLRNLQKNLVDVDRQQDAIVSDLTQLCDTNRKNASAILAEIRNGLALVFFTAATAAVMYLSFGYLVGYARVWGRIGYTLLLATTVGHSVAGIARRSLAGRREFLKLQETTRLRLRRRKKDLAAFRKSCDYVIELIESV